MVCLQALHTEVRVATNPSSSVCPAVLPPQGVSAEHSQATCRPRSKSTEVCWSCEHFHFTASLGRAQGTRTRRSKRHHQSARNWLWQTSKFGGAPQLQQASHPSCLNSKLLLWFNCTYRHNLVLTAAKDVVRWDLQPWGTVKVFLHLLLSLWWTCPTAPTAYCSLLSVIQQTN